MLPATIDRTAKQNELVAKYYAEYAAMDLDIYGLEELLDGIWSNSTMPELEADCRMDAIAKLKVDVEFEFHPA